MSQILPLNPISSVLGMAQHTMQRMAELPAALSLPYCAHSERLLHSPKQELFALMVRDGKERSIKNNYLRQEKKKKKGKQNKKQAP